MNQSQLNDYKAIVDGLPKRYSDYGFSGMLETENNKTYIELCKSYFKNGFLNFDGTTKKSICLTGNIGSGKTRLAVATLRNMIPKKNKSLSAYYDGSPRQHKSIYLLADKFFNKMNESASSGGKEKTINGFLEYDIILLDDLSFENFSTSKQENLYLLINEVYLQEKTIFITMNFSFKRLSQIEPRVADRLREMCFIMKFNDKSFRG